MRAALKKHVLFVDQFSDDLQNKIVACSKDAIRKAESCLPEEEKYFPQFYFDSIFSFIKYLYENGNKIRERE